MALNVGLLKTSVPWQLPYAAALPALNLLQPGIGCHSWSCSTSPFASPLHGPADRKTHSCASSPAPPAVPQPTTHSSNTFSAAAARALHGASGGQKRAKFGQLQQFFSGSSFAASGFRSFTATPLRHDEEEDHIDGDGAMLPGSRHRSTNRSTRHRVQHALHILQHGNVLTLRDMLAVKAETNFHITYNELIQMSKESGAAHSQPEAEELAEALSRSGVVLRYRNLIYLRPQEVADIIIKALPDSELEAQQKVEEIDAELHAMQDKIQHVDQTAERWSRFWLWGGCGLLALQLAAFIRLTWWELSWDVMEPFAYVIGLGNTLIGYIYFMVFRNNLDYQPFQDYWKNRTRSKAALDHQVDLARYEELLKLRTRYVQHMTAISSDVRPMPATVTP